MQNLYFEERTITEKSSCLIVRMFLRWHHPTDGVSMMDFSEQAEKTGSVTAKFSVDFMRIALREAQIAFDRDSVPVGAVVVKNGEVLASAGNEVMKNKDVTAHAEILAIRRAAAVLQSRILADCDIYVTLEPCAMCAQAISFARIANLYFGAYEPKYGAVVHGAQVFRYALYKPNFSGGILESECATLLKNFFLNKR